MAWTTEPQTPNAHIWVSPYQQFNTFVWNFKIWSAAICGLHSFIQHWQNLSHWNYEFPNISLELIRKKQLWGWQGGRGGRTHSQTALHRNERHQHLTSPHLPPPHSPPPHPACLSCFATILYNRETISHPGQGQKQFVSESISREVYLLFWLVKQFYTVDMIGSFACVIDHKGNSFASETIEFSTANKLKYWNVSCTNHILLKLTAGVLYRERTANIMVAQCFINDTLIHVIKWQKKIFQEIFLHFKNLPKLQNCRSRTVRQSASSYDAMCVHNVVSPFLWEDACSQSKSICPNYWFSMVLY